MPVIDVPVRGMTCQACEVRVAKHLRRVPGVEGVKVSVRRGVARVRTDAPVPRGRLTSAKRRTSFGGKNAKRRRADEHDLGAT